MTSRLRLFVLLSLALTVIALPIGQTLAQGGGFQGPEAQDYAPVTVEQASKMPTDSRVALTGKIIRQLGDTSYLFQNSTGSTVVRIWGWDGVEATPETTIVLYGEVNYKRDSFGARRFTNFKVKLVKLAD
jgi:uncharacterized protein (TIGR00156 family)